MRFPVSALLCLSAASELLVAPVSGENTNGNKVWKFGMASGGSSFFNPIHQGFVETCRSLGESNEIDIECNVFKENNTTELESFGYNATTDLKQCVAQMRYMLEQDYDGISMYCGIDHPIIKKALDMGVKMSSFDIRPPEQFPMPYVGTDNENVGFSMARLLRLLNQIEPGETGTYYAFSFIRIPARYKAFVSEIEKFNHRPDRGHWRMVTTNLTGNREGDDLEIGEELYPEHQEHNLTRLAELKPDAIIFMNQSPMRRKGYAEWVARNRQKGYSPTIVGLQGDDRELQTLARRNVDGLIGQVTFDIGRLSAETLYKQMVGIEVPPDQFTKLVNYNLVPEQLPEEDVEENLLDRLVGFGYFCFSTVAILALGCIAWTIYNRKGTVVRSSQPVFLIMTAAGVFIMASAIIPLSLERGDGTDINDAWATGVCMSIPWLAIMGFSVTFSALFAKTWRVNKFFHSDKAFARIQIRERDVLAPFAVVLFLNTVVLLVWSIVDPLKYTREFELGTDLYGREIESTGTCQSDHAEYFLVPLAVVNISLLIVSSVQAYNARNIKSEFSEASYIALAVFSLAQAFVTGIPVVTVVRDDPRAFYLVTTSILFVLSMVILLLIFLPKVLMHRKYLKMTPEERLKALAVSIRVSTLSKKSSSGISGLTPPPGHPQISGLHPPPSPRVAVPDHHIQGVKEETLQPQASKSEKDKQESTDRTDSYNERVDDLSDGKYGSIVEKSDHFIEHRGSTYAPQDVEKELKEQEKKGETLHSCEDSPPAI